MEPNKRKREEDEERVIDGMISLTSERRNSSQTNRLEGTFFRKKKLSLFGTTFILQQRRRRSEHVDDNLDDVVTEAIDAISSQNPSIKVLIESFQSNQINNTNSNSSSLDDMTTAQSNLQFVEFVLFVFNLIEQITVFNDIPEIPLPASLSSPDNSAEMKPNENKKEKFKFKASNPSTMFEKHWRDHFQELAHFKNVNGHCNVSRTTKGFEQLGNWLADQRRKLRRGKLTKEQYQMLTDLGVEWDRSYYFVARAVV